MEMEGCQKNSLSLEDFRDKCRICLKNNSDMIDALASGISNTVMEVINIKVTVDDELSTFICQDCVEQLEKFYNFQSLAKNSDNYLKTLLLAKKCFSQETENDKMKMSCGKNKKFKKKVVQGKKSNSNDYDKMYLILVNKGTKDSESQNEIFIKDLGCENGNTILTKFCRSLINARSEERNSPLEESEKALSNDAAENLTAEGLGSDVLKVDWFVYQCNTCKESFQTEDCLSEHLKILHGNEISMTSISYICIVCATSIDDKNLFLEHLKTHTTEDFSFSKIDDDKCFVDPKDLKEETPPPASLDSSKVLKNRVFRVNTSCCKCFLCDKLEPTESIKDHLKECYPDFDQEENHLKFHLKYTCPVCSTSWLDDGCEDFKQHLLSHRENNIFFIKVNNLGEPDELTAGDFMFTPFEKALEVLKFCEKGDESAVCKGSKIIKMRSLLSCKICSFETNSVNLLSQHYSETHDSKRPISCVCPVCCEDFKFFDLREMSKFQYHMVNHKEEEGICFLKMNSNGTVASDSSDSSGLFSDLNDFLLGKVRCPELEFMSSISAPVVFLKRTDDCSAGERLAEKDDAPPLKVVTKKQTKSAREFMCEKCGKECIGKVNYRRHFLSHEKDEACIQKRPKCLVCDKTFSNRSILTEHKRYHKECKVERGAAQKICEICGRSLSNNASLAKHRKLHTKEKEIKILKCKICERNFRTESTLKRHMSAHMNPNYFECEECKLPLPSLASLGRHKLVHQNTSSTYECSVCKISFLTKDRLTSHETHTGHNQNRKRFECNVCHERFFIGKEFTKHIKLHPKYKMSECPLCGKRLSTMQSLMLHLDRHFESNSILCPHCGKQCFEERNYRRHLLTHEGVKPFTCKVEGCEKSFYTFFEIKRHIKYHNNTRDFSCTYCPKSFHESNHLKVHIRTHTGEKPYTCPHCSKSFVTRTRCKQHINLVHQGVGYELIQSKISKKVAVFETLDTAA